jgi:hypothetical protein
MNKYTLAILVALTFGLICCQQKNNDDHQDHDANAPDKTEISPNQKLYNEVMKIHDEVMPKMDDIHRLRMSIREQIEKNPNLPKAERIKLDAMYAKLDSANEGMMVWMREFRPLPDSLGEEKATAYLQSEMKRVKVVRDRMLNAIEAAQKQK